MKSFLLLFFEANTRNKTVHTMWKGMKNLARKQLLFLCTILFEVSWAFGKMWNRKLLVPWPNLYTARNWDGLYLRFNAFGLAQQWRTNKRGFTLSCPSWGVTERLPMHCWFMPMSHSQCFSWPASSDTSSHHLWASTDHHSSGIASGRSQASKF